MTLTERCELLAPMPCRQALRVTWLTDDLVRTDGARARLRRWCDAKFPEGDASHVHILTGDLKMSAWARDGLRRLPPPVLHHVEHNVIVVVIGPRHRGFEAVLPALATPHECVQVVVMKGDDTEPEERLAVLGHELAHAWLAPVATTTPTPETEAADLEHAALYVQLANDWGMWKQALAPYRIRERRAGALARAWGFSGLAANPDSCSERARLPGDRWATRGDRRGMVPPGASAKTGKRGATEP